MATFCQPLATGHTFAAVDAKSQIELVLQQQIHNNTIPNLKLMCLTMITYLNSICPCHALGFLLGRAGVFSKVSNCFSLKFNGFHAKKSSI
jgi:hypothetical protein